jgi:hypothetical protein
MFEVGAHFKGILQILIAIISYDWVTVIVALRPTHIALAISTSGSVTSSAIEVIIPVAEKQYAP